MKYFTAENAHELTQLYRNSKIERELDSIYEKIKLAIHNGDYFVTLDYYGKVMSPGVIQALKEKGFIIKEFYGDQRDPFHDITISWVNLK